MYNLGCAFEQTGSFARGLKCFTQLAKIQPNIREAFYGIALCFFKLDDFANALKNIEIAINDKSHEMTKGKHYTYLRALCYKQLEKFEEATKYYKDIRHEFVLQDIPKVNVENMLMRYYKVNDGWVTDKKNTVLSILYKQAFFRRFNKSELEQILKFMEIRIQPANALLFLYKTEVAVVLQGEAMIYSHTSDLSKPQMVALYGPGGIIGHSESDQGVSRHPENWIKSRTSIELCVFSKDSFDVIHFHIYKSILITNRIVCMVHAKD